MKSTHFFRGGPRRTLPLPGGRVGARPRTFRPRLECLETRRVLSATQGVLASAHVVVLDPGDSIQAAVNAASPGTRIELEPGIYTQRVKISTPDLQLVGLTGPNDAQAVLQAPAGAGTGITVASPGGSILEGFTLQNVVVRGFAHNGVFLKGVDHFTLTHVAVENNQEYGLFPVFSSHGLIEFSTASGSNDTGIYVGQSTDITIRHNIAFNNVNGIEIENSTFVQAVDNRVFDNTVGILDDLLPRLTIEVSADNLIQHNVVLDNNRPNTAPPGDIASFEPSGIGIFLIGGNHTLVEGNAVLANGAAGIALASGKDLIKIAHLPKHIYGSTDPDPEYTTIRDNVVLGNGLLFGGADLVWTGYGKLNHFEHNLYVTSSPGHLPS